MNAPQPRGSRVPFAQSGVRKALTALTLSTALTISGMTAAPTMLPRATAATSTTPTSTSATSLYASNWRDLTAVWMASQLNQNDNSNYGPRIGELRTANQMSTNQIVDYTGFFRDGANNAKYDQVHNFASNAFLDENGVLNTTYGAYSGKSLPVTVKRDYAVVPNQEFMVVRYTLSNSTSKPYPWQVLDQVHLNNTQGQKLVSGGYDSQRNALIGDMTASGQDTVVLGAMQQASSYQAGDDSDCKAADATASAWCQFDDHGSLGNNASVNSSQVDLGFANTVTIPANGSSVLYYYVAAGSSRSAALTAADAARAQNGAYWFTNTSSSYQAWLKSGKTVSTGDTGVDTAYLRNLVVEKNSQNPVNGLWPASTNPASYGYKTWMRDASFVAMSLDAAGHYAEAEKYWSWMAAHQGTNGAWGTCYDEWSGNYVSFVEPEYDSVGLFLVGVLKHYQDTHSTAFLNAVWPSVQAAANFTQTNISSSGLGAADASIWEESIQYNIFTQAFDVAGLRAAALLAKVQGQSASQDAWNGAASTILSSIQRSDTWSPAGLWNSNGYFDRGINTDGSVNPLLDSSQQALIMLGDIDASSSRAASLVAYDESHLTHDGLGLARYTGDPFYYSSPYSPAGNEAQAAEAVWPNVTMMDAMGEVYQGQMSKALARLQWYVSRTGVGFMPPGEAISWVTARPMVSTMSEPLTAASFLLGALTYTGQFDARVQPSSVNAGARATLNVSSTPSSDWAQYAQIPYFTDAKGDATSGSSTTDIAKAYLANDDKYLYVRIDNASGSLPTFASAPKFGVLVYSDDFSHAGGSVTSSAYYGSKSLDHSARFAVGRWSDSNNYSSFVAGTSGWGSSTTLQGTPPQWDPATGRIEMAIPLSALSSGNPTMGSWSNLTIELATQSSTGTWSDDDVMNVNYRLTNTGQDWLYGNA